MPGRKTKLTPEIQQTIASVLRSGLPEESAARIAGVSGKTLRRWKKRGKKGKSSEHRELYKAMEEAKSGFECFATSSILKSGKWEAIAWLLAQLRPSVYGKKVAPKKVKRDIKSNNEEEA